MKVCFSILLEMLDKDPALSHLIKDTNLEIELSKNSLDLVDKISVGKDVVKIGVSLLI